MQIDKGWKFNEAQAFSATAFSTDSPDLTIGRNLFAGEPLCPVFNVNVAADLASGDETYTFDILTDDNAAMSSPTVLINRPISRTLLLAGTFWHIPVPFDVVMERFIGFRANLGGTTPSITLTAWVAPCRDVDQWKAYTDAIVIS